MNARPRGLAEQENPMTYAPSTMLSDCADGEPGLPFIVHRRAEYWATLVSRKRTVAIVGARPFPSSYLAVDAADSYVERHGASHVLRGGAMHEAMPALPRVNPDEDIDARLLNP